MSEGVWVALVGAAITFVGWAWRQYDGRRAAEQALSIANMRLEEANRKIAEKDERLEAFERHVPDVVREATLLLAEVRAHKSEVEEGDPPAPEPDPRRRSPSDLPFPYGQRGHRRRGKPRRPS